MPRCVRILRSSRCDERFHGVLLLFLLVVVSAAQGSARSVLRCCERVECLGRREPPQQRDLGGGARQLARQQPRERARCRGAHGCIALRRQRCAERRRQRRPLAPGRLEVEPVQIRRERIHKTCHVSSACRQRGRRRAAQALRAGVRLECFLHSARARHRAGRAVEIQADRVVVHRPERRGQRRSVSGGTGGEERLQRLNPGGCVRRQERCEELSRLGAQEGRRRRALEQPGGGRGAQRGPVGVTQRGGRLGRSHQRRQTPEANLDAAARPVPLGCSAPRARLGSFQKGVSRTALLYAAAPVEAAQHRALQRVLATAHHTAASPCCHSRCSEETRVGARDVSKVHCKRVFLQSASSTRALTLRPPSSGGASACPGSAAPLAPRGAR